MLNHQSVIKDSIPCAAFSRNANDILVIAVSEGISEETADATPKIITQLFCHFICERLLSNPQDDILEPAIIMAELREGLIRIADTYSLNEKQLAATFAGAIIMKDKTAHLFQLGHGYNIFKFSSTVNYNLLTPDVASLNSSIFSNYQNATYAKVCNVNFLLLATKGTDNILMSNFKKGLIQETSGSTKTDPNYLFKLSDKCLIGAPLKHFCETDRSFALACYSA